MVLRCCPIQLPFNCNCGMSGYDQSLPRAKNSLANYMAVVEVNRVAVNHARA